MLYCFDKDLPFEYSKSEMALTKKEGNGILYDYKLSIFTDFLGNEIDIKGKKIFPRTGASQIYAMNEAISNHGGKLLISSEEINKIIDWPKYYKTKRNMSIFLGTDLINPNIINEIENKFGKEIFIKTLKKNFSSVIPISLLKDSECVFYKALQYHLDDKFIISDSIKIISDEYGAKEYRCFVINNEPYNISRFTTEIFHHIDSSVLEKLNEIIATMKNIFPNSYVVDLMEYETNKGKFIDVVEFNPIHCSGLYLYNSVLEKSKDILHTKNIRRISKEFIPKIARCKMEGQVINAFNNDGNLYEIRNGFSSDLRSVYLTGERGIIFAMDVNMTVECFAKKATAFEWERIISNEDLCQNSSDIELEQELSSYGVSEEEQKKMIASLKRLLKEEKK